MGKDVKIFFKLTSIMEFLEESHNIPFYHPPAMLENAIIISIHSRGFISPHLLKSFDYLILFKILFQHQFICLSYERKSQPIFCWPPKLSLFVKEFIKINYLVPYLRILLINFSIHLIDQYDWIPCWTTPTCGRIWHCNLLPLAKQLSGSCLQEISFKVANLSNSDFKSSLWSVSSEVNPFLPSFSSKHDISLSNLLLFDP